MIVEVKGYASSETLILVSEIVSVELNSKYDINDGTSLAKHQYEFNVNLKTGINIRFWYNGEKERCDQEYKKVKKALSDMYRTNTIEQEITNYLSKMQK